MNSILLIGSGGCGNKLLETGLTIIDESFGTLGNTYDSVFINSNLNEMNTLSHFKIGENGLYISGQGTGRDREVAKISMKNDRSKFMNYFSPKAPNYHMAVILISADGGFGSGSIETLSKVLKSINPNIKTMIVGAMPKYNSRKISIENACLLHKDVISLREDGFIDSVLYINNEKMNNETIDDEEVKLLKEDEEATQLDIKRVSDKETKFNFRVMEQLIHALDLHGGSVDVSDTFKTSSAKGYELILPISDDCDSLTSAIDKSVSESPFVLPSELTKKTDEKSLVTCSHLVGIYNNKYDKDDWQRMFDVTTFDKNDYSNDNHNLIFANGFNMPTNFMNMLKSNLSKLKNKITSNSKNDNFEFTLSKEEEEKIPSQDKIKNNNEEKTEEVKEKKSSVKSALEKRKAMDNLIKNLF